MDFFHYLELEHLDLLGLRICQNDQVFRLSCLWNLPSQLGTDHGSPQIK